MDSRVGWRLSHGGVTAIWRRVHKYEERNDEERSPGKVNFYIARVEDQNQNTVCSRYSVEGTPLSQHHV